MARIEATGFESLKAGKAEDAKEKKWSARQRRKNSQGRAEFLKVSPIHDQTDWRTMAGCLKAFAGDEEGKKSRIQMRSSGFKRPRFQGQIFEQMDFFDN